MAHPPCSLLTDPLRLVKFRAEGGAHPPWSTPQPGAACQPRAATDLRADLHLGHRPWSSSKPPWSSHPPLQQPHLSDNQSTTGFQMVVFF